MLSSKIATAEQPLRLSISEAPNEPFVAWNGRDGDQLVSREDLMQQEEEIRSVMGVSISRAQTRLMSPRTPRAEKVAALESTSDGAFFDGTYEDGLQEDPARMSAQSGLTEAPKMSRVPDSSSADLPSPWRATAKIFERTKSQDEKDVSSRPQTSTGPTSTLIDLNIKRFLSSFHMLSLPGGATLKDFSIPTISTLFGGNKSSSQLQKSETRTKRASTLSFPSSHWINVGQFGKRPAATVPTSRQDSGSEVGNEATTVTPQIGRNQNPSDLVPDTSPSMIHNSSRATSLRRVKSDQSLMLRHSRSNGSTLGDDSRWEHVQDQVNSRFKAIVDSLQDSNIKLPSLPSLPNINFNNLRPDFTRNRAWSDTRKPTSFQDGNLDNATIHQHEHASGSNSQATNDGWPNVSNVASKVSKPILSQLDQALDQLTGDLVIMGGYRGSVLRSAKPPNRQLWVPVKVGLNIRKVNLEVGLSREDEEDMEDRIIPSGMLSHIGPVDMGRRLLKRLRGCANAQQGKLRVHDYGYDWRLSPDLLSAKLVAFLETLPSNSKETPDQDRGATVIAHSMGGLITRHAVNQRPELFSGVVYAGTPQHCINILGPMRNGDDVLLSSRVLTAQVNFTLRTSFLLLPEDGKCFVNKLTKEEYPVNFFDVEDWKQHAFSPCIASTLSAASQPEKKGILGSVSGSLPSLPLPGRRSFSLLSSKDAPETTHAAFDAANPASTALDSHLSSSTSVSTLCTIPLPAALSYLERTLAATVAFKNELAFEPLHQSRNQYPPLSILYSTSVPTVLAARVASRDGIRRADAYDDLAFGSGDGVCLAKAAMLPPGYEYARGGRVRTERGHVGLLGDLEAVGKCLTAVQQARERGVGLGRGGGGGGSI
ncbi:hypothetical protein MMC07_004539 [Pseudocyphellaria aurata]|nr:hypothetical protein [Pseudocyphellaria aurata]